MSDINYEFALNSFKEYLKQFDTKDEKIALKIGHTMRVVGSAKEIADKLGLNEEDTSLAVLIALLHDIGRFVQLRDTGSFDDSIIPHAVISNRILFEEGMIREFVKSDIYDEIIFTAIKNHGLYKMEEIEDKRTLLHSKIIRDADKMDNFHTKLIEKMTTMLDVDEDELNQEPVSDYAYNTFMSNNPLVNALRETHLDMWISYIAYIYDLNFKESLEIVKEHDYVNRLFERVNPENEYTKMKMDEMRKCMIEFLG